MKTRLITWFAGLALFILVLASILTAAAASNTVPPTRLGEETYPITATDLKPVECAEITLTAIYYCPFAKNNQCTATTQSELVLGRPETTHIDGGGGGGMDCCIGSPGTHFKNCAWPLK